MPDHTLTLSATSATIIQPETRPQITIPEAVRVAVLAGRLVDVSSGNDAIPCSFVTATQAAGEWDSDTERRLWIDYDDPAAREHPENARYSTGIDPTDVYFAESEDDVETVLAMLYASDAELVYLPGVLGTEPCAECGEMRPVRARADNPDYPEVVCSCAVSSGCPECERSNGPHYTGPCAH